MAAGANSLLIGRNDAGEAPRLGGARDGGRLPNDREANAMLNCENELRLDLTCGQGRPWGAALRTPHPAELQRVLRRSP